VEGYRSIVLVIGLWILGGCAGTTGMNHERPSLDPMMDMLHRGILDLDENVRELNGRIAELQQMPPVQDPLVHELRALDLSGWQLHQQQWIMQRERLVFALHQIQRARTHPTEKSDLWAQWTTRQQQFVTALEDLRAQRHALEKKRLAVESQLLEHYFK
jgi:hypothetical protein